MPKNIFDILIIYEFIYKVEFLQFSYAVGPLGILPVLGPI